MFISPENDTTKVSIPGNRKSYEIIGNDAEGREERKSMNC
jgi:hypothetical protein